MTDGPVGMAWDWETATWRLVYEPGEPRAIRDVLPDLAGWPPREDES